MFYLIIAIISLISFFFFLDPEKGKAGNNMLGCKGNRSAGRPLTA